MLNFRSRSFTKCSEDRAYVIFLCSRYTFAVLPYTPSTKAATASRRNMTGTPGLKSSRALRGG